jgi:Ca-activated chloride channel family protein
MSLAFLGFPHDVQLANPEYLLLLILLAGLIVLYFLRQVSSTSSVVFSAVPIAKKVRPSGWVRFRHLPAILLWCATAAMIIALARPQTVKYETLEEVLDYGADIMLVMDVSGSMEALDFQPHNRLHVAKEVVTNFIGGRKGDHIGLVAFAGVAAATCPLTTNMEYLAKKIDELDFGLLEDGTAIGTALSTALNRLTGSKAKSKVIILLTDGINNRGEVLPIDAASIAKKMEVKVYTVGVGSDAEVPFPNKPPYYGRSMRVGLDEELLGKIAEITGAVYRKATDPRSLEEVYQEIDKLEKTEVKARIYSYPVETEYFHWFIFTAVGLLAAELLLRWTRLSTVP